MDNELNDVLTFLLVQTARHRPSGLRATTLYHMMPICDTKAVHMCHMWLGRVRMPLMSMCLLCGMQPYEHEQCVFASAAPPHPTPEPRPS